MSSILIKGMEMPKHYMKMEFGYDANGTPQVIVGEEVYDVIHVPPHGRLGDLDALMKQVEHDTPLSEVYEKTMRRYLNNAPTIIEAEE